MKAHTTHTQQKNGIRTRSLTVRSPPRSTSTRRASTRPPAAAACMGVAPSRSTAFAAPAMVHRCAHTLEWPRKAARCSAVAPVVRARRDSWGREKWMDGDKGRGGFTNHLLLCREHPRLVEAATSQSLDCRPRPPECKQGESNDNVVNTKYIATSQGKQTISNW